MRVKYETERLILRTMVPEDYEAAFRWCKDPEVNTYMLYPLYTCAEDVKTWLESRDQDDPDNYDVGIVLKETGELIGSGGLVYKAKSDVWIVGYNICSDQWGNGYVPEAIQGLLEEVGKVRNIRIVEGEFALENHKSRRVMEKLGMHYHRDGEYEKLDGSRRFQSRIYRREF